MTDILKERDERGGYIVPLRRWWKFTFNTRTPTWEKFGCIAYVEATLEPEAQTAATAAAQREFPGAEILPLSLLPSTAQAAEAFAALRQRHATWQANALTGTPNKREDLEPRRGDGHPKPFQVGQPGESKVNDTEKVDSGTVASLIERLKHAIKVIENSRTLGTSWITRTDHDEMQTAMREAAAQLTTLQAAHEVIEAAKTVWAVTVATSDHTQWFDALAKLGHALEAEAQVTTLQADHEALKKTLRASEQPALSEGQDLRASDGEGSERNQ